MEYRKLTPDEIDRFIEMRIAQLVEEGWTEDTDLRPALRDYYRRHMEDGTFVSWLAVDGGRIAGTSGMSMVEKPPGFDNPTGRLGIVSSMFVRPDCRGQGIAGRLLDLVIGEARAFGCGAVEVTASDAGVGFYTAYGFEPYGNYRRLTLRKAEDPA